MHLGQTQGFSTFLNEFPILVSTADDICVLLLAFPPKNQIHLLKYDAFRWFWRPNWRTFFSLEGIPPSHLHHSWLFHPIFIFLVNTKSVYLKSDAFRCNTSGLWHNSHKVAIILHLMLTVSSKLFLERLFKEMVCQVALVLPSHFSTTSQFYYLQ